MTDLQKTVGYLNSNSMCYYLDQDFDPNEVWIEVDDPGFRSMLKFDVLTGKLQTASFIYLGDLKQSDLQDMISKVWVDNQPVA